MTGNVTSENIATQSTDGVTSRRALIASELERMLASRAFGRSPRHRAFLRHIVEVTLNGEHARLKESTIALEVFQRDAAQFDSTTDSIVRVEAARLRQKVERFYAAEGATSPVVIEMVAGNYRPRFVDRAVNVGSPPTISPALRTALPPDLPAAVLARYERAWYMMRARTLDGYRKALALFDEAVSLRPEFAAAHRGAAWARINIAGHPGVPPDAGDQGAGMAAAIARAEVIEPDHPELDSLAGAYLSRFRLDLDAAEERYLTGLRRAPEAWGSRSSYAWLLIMRGRFNEAQRLFDTEFNHDPFAFFMRHNFGLLAYFQRDYERSKRIFAEALDMEPGHLIVRIARASVLIASGDAGMAVEDLTLCCMDHGGLGGLELERIRALAAARRHAEARKALADFDRHYAHRYYSPVYRCAVHVALDDHCEALGWLERAASVRDYWLINVLIDPAFDALRDEPRFVQAMRGAGLRPLAKAA